MDYVYSDGGRAEAGFKGRAGDCVARSIAIVAGLPYLQVYDRLALGNATQRASKRTPKRGRSASGGINVRRKWFRDYMVELGFTWVPIMAIGAGCTVHLAEGELPNGRLVVSLSKHYCAVIDGVIYDTCDPRRDDSWLIEPGGKITKIGGRCVYGYWRFDHG